MAIIIIIAFILVWIVLKDLSDEKELERQNCYDLEGCEVYGCLAEDAIIIHRANNYLLKEQNCLLKEDVPKTDGGRS